MVKVTHNLNNDNYCSVVKMFEIIIIFVNLYIYLILKGFPIDYKSIWYNHKYYKYNEIHVNIKDKE